ncbi:MAG: ABC transporter substrate-binding protein, partial [Candidatus Rokubacteria bacterium]|nr:ABC transporter substrate-binding protein [Candidatus Rokubacteria bacterium]
MIPRVVAFGLMLLLTALPAGAQEPIRVGFITDLTGPLAQPGKEMENGIRLFLGEHKNTLSGRPVELTVLDAGSSPAVALTKARELVEQRKVHVVIGPLPAFEAYAIVPYLNEKRIPSLSPSAAADDLTQRKATQFFVRVASTSSQPTQPFGTYAVKTLGYKKIATIADDFAFGHEVVAGFQKAFEDAGGQIVQKLWPPLGTKDQGPFIAQLRKDIDAVFIGFAGVAALRFLKQFEEAGLKGK